MGLLDAVKEIKENRVSNQTLPLGEYSGELVKMARGNVGDYEVIRMRYQAENEAGSKGILEDTIFFGDTEEKTEKAIGSRALPYYEAGILSTSAMQKAMENIDGFIDYWVKQSKNANIKLKLTETTSKKNGNVYRNVNIISVGDPNKTENSDDINIDNEELPF